ncbi:hypothetical protein EYF80_042590 [Liparis tanakae]|uniref:Uncharacterized protein n=1 Tax=Liparis tanakae TaxID=230148 RepID=A0A4Z2G107_9TELE|nr:hypothetical protein EYF80_042590 [Liparis tanakae]
MPKQPAHSSRAMYLSLSASQCSKKRLVQCSMGMRGARRGEISVWVRYLQHRSSSPGTQTRGDEDLAGHAGTGRLLSSSRSYRVTRTFFSQSLMRSGNSLSSLSRQASMAHLVAKKWQEVSKVLLSVPHT